ncbi:hypothetical protein [Paenibacillus xylaniclasticus]|uniref:hypothetical protein n=1 Tax=Paenibacillus xylaniclasticus TaxID=588083 RepID=UPI000FDBA546|nr:MULTISPECIES: hypothetical protein [Paenibacillus]GFN30052.1 hypothetical protein PCURB6_03120 [Paenibacillus curdlanolyticus]
MKANGWQGSPIDVVKMPDGKLTTVDNTRVLAARNAGINVEAVGTMQVTQFRRMLHKDLYLKAVKYQKHGEKQ